MGLAIEITSEPRGPNMVAASVTDVQPHADRMVKAKATLKAAVDANASDEQLQAHMGSLLLAMSTFDEKVKVARSCIPKTSKPKGSAAAKGTAAKPKGVPP